MRKLCQEYYLLMMIQSHLNLMGQAARLLGHQAILARTGADALVKAGEQNPGVIFLDLMMPDMDGLQVLGHLRKQDKTQS